MFSYIIWNVHPEMFSLGFIKAAWYGLLFAMAFLAGQYVLGKIFKIEGKTEKDLEKFTFYIIIATVLGARLGHCLFYQPDYYLANPIEILKIWEGGLASHGAAVGILYATFLYSKRQKVSYLWILDRLVIVVALGGAFIRMGNLMNSEIVGTPTNQAQAFVFANRWIANSLENYEDANKIGYLKNHTEKSNFQPIKQKDIELVPLEIHTYFDAEKISAAEAQNFMQRHILLITQQDKEVSEHLVLSNTPKFKTTEEDGKIMVSWQAYGVPRHPSQLYEAVSTLLLFFLLLGLYARYQQKTPEGLLFSLFVIILFSLRILYEYQKENQVDGENAIKALFGMNLGQLLSIPLVLAGIWILIRTFKKKKLNEN
ncbi:MAG: prolipoprotein diacylglyceryl transferase [Thermonemataceae bacterium]|nr:prolipoprotein diacylglyceryl transferase [Thermonemataceae bacterium]